jgi:hypothetical protein
MESLLDFTPLGLTMKARNALFDTVFYDVGALTFDEWMRLNPLADRKGKVIVVSPAGSQKPESIRHYESVQAFNHSKDWNSVFAVVVTGVGSSVVGTAALARNVADACKGIVEDEAGDVAGVVSGFGASDVVQEGLGGYFFYGMLNQYRFLFETAVENTSAIISDSFAKVTNIRDQVGKFFGTPLPDYVPIGADVHALEHILDARYLHRNTSIRLLVGHSKGNLLIADTLDHMSDEYKGVKHKAFHNLAVVTLGAVVDIAEDMIPRKNQYQFLGAFDGLGRINSRWTQEGLAPHTSLPGRWHSLNRKLPLHTDLFDILQDQVAIPEPPRIERGQDGRDPVGRERMDILESAWKTAEQKAAANGH